MPTVADILLTEISRTGATHVFGVPGGPLLSFVDALSISKTPCSVLAKHEAGAAFMALGYAQLGRRMGVVCATTAPGATNALTGVASATSDSVPLLAITAQVPTTAVGREPIQDSSGGNWSLDLVSMYRSATKLSAGLPAPQETGRLTRHAIRTALNGRPGAVHLNVPADFMSAEVTAEDPGPQPMRLAPAPDPVSVDRLLDWLRTARRPVLLAGQGAKLAGAHAGLLRLAEALSVPVATTLKGKSVFPEEHSLALGVFGFGGIPAARAAVLAEDVDLLVVLGSSLGEVASDAWTPALVRGRKVCQIDIEATQIGKCHRVDLGITGDAADVVDTLLERMRIAERRADTAGAGAAADIDDDPDLRVVGRTSGPGPEGSRPGAARPVVPRPRPAASLPRPAAPRQGSDALPGPLPSAEPPLAPLGSPGTRFPGGAPSLRAPEVVDRLSALLPDDTALFVDNGNALSWVGECFTAGSGRDVFLSFNVASMGYAAPAAIGGKLAAPDRPVVALVGDAAFAMTGMEVHTAVEYEVPVVFVVLNNGGHAMVHNIQMNLFGRSHDALFGTALDLAAVARGLGARSATVTELPELDRAVESALGASGPFLIDVRVDAEDVPWALGNRMDILRASFGERGGL
ncbi:thiamine pyrophosphate-binding protein [Streptomyces sp. URMC 123]|uniref:thiamine pyrophosphate-binding protein n=1 Tax=Streptomyces sp. URMC 123 TaxID=3423403 RepID=UPI003F1C8372